MIIISPTGTVVRTSEKVAKALLKGGWTEKKETPVRKPVSRKKAPTRAKKEPETKVEDKVEDKDES